MQRGEGTAVYQRKTSWREARTHLVFSVTTTDCELELDQVNVTQPMEKGFWLQPHEVSAVYGVSWLLLIEGAQR